jgi:hypothetical protein
MKCIWIGDMKSRVDRIKLQAVLENCHTWAMRVLRPWISGYIDLWKHNICLQSSKPTSDTGDMIEADKSLYQLVASEIEESVDEDQIQNDVLVSALREIMKQELGTQHDKLQAALRPLLLDTMKQELRTQHDIIQTSLRPLMPDSNPGMIKISTTRDMGTQTDDRSTAPGGKSSKPAVVSKVFSDTTSTAYSFFSFEITRREWLSRQKLQNSLIHIRSFSVVGDGKSMWRYAPPNKVRLHKAKLPLRGKNILIRLPIIYNDGTQSDGSTHSSERTNVRDTTPMSANFEQLSIREPVPAIPGNPNEAVDKPAFGKAEDFEFTFDFKL